MHVSVLLLVLFFILSQFFYSQDLCFRYLFVTLRILIGVLPDFLCPSPSFPHCLSFTRWFVYLSPGDEECWCFMEHPSADQGTAGKHPTLPRHRLTDLLSSGGWRCHTGCFEQGGPMLKHRGPLKMSEASCRAAVQLPGFLGKQCSSPRLQQPRL